MKDEHEELEANEKLIELSLTEGEFCTIQLGLIGLYLEREDKKVDSRVLTQMQELLHKLDLI